MDVVTGSVLAERLGARGWGEPRIVVAGNFATPWELLRTVTGATERARLFVLNAQPGWPDRDGLITETPFVGAGVRHHAHLDYLPMRLSLVPRLFGTVRPPDVVLLHTTAPRRGRLSLGIEVNILPAAVEAVRARGGLVLAQINPQMPYTFGDSEIDVSDVDLAIEVDSALSSPEPRRLDDGAVVIGQRVADHVGDGATMQVGIGQLPDAVLSQLTKRRALAVWSEMVSDGIMALDRTGALDRERQMVSTFLFGSREFYDWVDDNPRLVMRRTEVANDPAQIARQRSMLSINTALEVDLYAQANASHVRGAVYSGFGGQPDFVAGALHSSGGHAVLALRSWHDKSGVSNVVPLLRAPVCSFQHSAIVSEQGTASLFGRSQRAQARALIEQVADPRARDVLRESAHHLESSAPPRAAAGTTSTVST